MPTPRPRRARRQRTPMWWRRSINLVPGVQVVQAVDFVSDDPDCSGTMTMTWELSRAEAGTRIEIRAEDVPDLTPDSRGPQATLKRVADMDLVFQALAERGVRHGSDDGDAELIRVEIRRAA